MERARNFCFTLNNYTAEEVEAVKGWDCKYLIFGKEVGESQTPHLQGYVSFQNGKTLSALKKYSVRAHWEIARGTPKQASEYCEKEGDVFEKGVRPLSQAEKGSAEKERWTSVINLARLGNVEEIQDSDPQAYLQYHSAIDKIIGKRKRDLADLPDDYRAIWIWGPTNVGKSDEIRHLVDRPKEKAPREKWWPRSYNGTDPILLDEVGKNSGKQSEDFKIWLDRYVMPEQEVKNGNMDVRPVQVYVTSQYSIRDIWLDPADYLAIERRCLIIHKTMRGRVLPGFRIYRNDRYPSDLAPVPPGNPPDGSEAPVRLLP